MKCARPNCPNKSQRHDDLCKKHRTSSPRHNVPAGPVIDHYNALRAAGMSCALIAKASGVHRDTLRLAGQWTHGGTVRHSTAQKVLSVPIPTRPVAGGARAVPGLSTRRRLQALSAIGWPLHLVAEKMGRTLHPVWQSTQTEFVTATTAAEVHKVYGELHLTAGPSERARDMAKRKHWPVPLAWDDISNPDEHPILDEPEPVSFLELYIEMRDHLGLSDAQIAKRQGILRQSLDTKLRRHGIEPRRTA